MPDRSRWFVVVNPAAAGGRAERRWPSLAAELSRAGVELEVVSSGGPGHATALTRDAVRAGFRRVLAAGGDGILHEAVNGIMTQTEVPAHEVCIGAAPLGSGNDWARGRGLPRSGAALAACVAAGRSSPHDVGRLEFAGGGEPAFFINVAGAGFDAYVLARLPARVPRRFAYVLGLLDSLRSYEVPRFRVAAGSRTVSSPLLLALIAIGPYCGGGMRLAPTASAADGLLDLVTVAPLRLPHDLLRLRRLFDGRVLQEDIVAHSLEPEVLIESDPPVPVEADGQLVGQTPVRAGVLPDAIRALAP